MYCHDRQTNKSETTVCKIFNNSLTLAFVTSKKYIVIYTITKRMKRDDAGRKAERFPTHEDRSAGHPQE